MELHSPFYAFHNIWVGYNLITFDFFYFIRCNVWEQLVIRWWDRPYPMQPILPRMASCRVWQSKTWMTTIKLLGFAWTASLIILIDRTGVASKVCRVVLLQLMLSIILIFSTASLKMMLTQIRYLSVLDWPLHSKSKFYHQSIIMRGVHII